MLPPFPGTKLSPPGYLATAEEWETASNEAGSDFLVGSP